jgi:prevent-host-death family protein
MAPFRAPVLDPRRELRNDVTRILREAESGTESTVTVRGRPVARLGPPQESPDRRVDVDLATVQAILGRTPVDAGFGDEISRMRDLEEPAAEPGTDA